MIQLWVYGVLTSIIKFVKIRLIILMPIGEGRRQNNLSLTYVIQLLETFQCLRVKKSHFLVIAAFLFVVDLYFCLTLL
jgi:hypothetical protein